MKLILLSLKNKEKDQYELKLVNEMFQLGLINYHIVKPQHSKEEIAQYLDQIPKKYHRHIILNKHFDLSSNYNIKGIHQSTAGKNNDLNQHLRVQLTKIKKPKLRLSTRVKSLDSLKIAGRFYHRVYLSPVFKSLSKRSYRHAYDWTQLENILSQVKAEVFAAGGINKAKIEEARNLHFKGVIVNGAVWDADDPVASCKELLETASNARSFNSEYS